MKHKLPVLPKLPDWSEREISALFTFAQPQYDPDPDVLYCGELIDVEFGMNVPRHDASAVSAKPNPPMSLSDLMSTAYTLAGNLFEIKPKK